MAQRLTRPEPDSYAVLPPIEGHFRKVEAEAEAIARNIQGIEIRTGIAATECANDLIVDQQEKIGRAARLGQINGPSTDALFIDPVDVATTEIRFQ